MTRKIKSGFAMLLVCFAFATVTKSTQPTSGKVWLAITHLMSIKNAPTNAVTAVGAIGIMDAAAWGFAVGSIGTPVAGVIAGAAAGL